MGDKAVFNWNGFPVHTVTETQALLGIAKAKRVMALSNLLVGQVANGVVYVIPIQDRDEQSR